jgi:hypothetical protein
MAKKLSPKSDDVPTKAWTLPSIPLHESISTAQRARELGLDNDVVVVSLPAKRAGGS